MNPNASSSVLSLAVEGSTVYAGGTFNSIGGQPRIRIAAIGANTGLANTWNPGANSNVFELLASGGSLYVGGLFTAVGNVAHQGIACVSQATTVGVPSSDVVTSNRADAIEPEPDHRPVLDLLRAAASRGGPDRRVRRPGPSGGASRRRLADGRPPCRDVDGRGRTARATPGVYLVRFEAEGQVFNRRVVLLR